MKKKDKIHLLGVIIAVMSVIGLSRSYEGHGSVQLPLIAFIIGLLMVLVGYIK